MTRREFVRITTFAIEKATASLREAEVARSTGDYGASEQLKKLRELQLKALQDQMTEGFDAEPTIDMPTGDGDDEATFNRRRAN